MTTIKTFHNRKALALFLLTLFCLAGALQAQTTNTTYFMNTYSNRTSLNPALRPEQGYLGMPLLLNNLYVDVKTNTLNLDHLTFKQGGEVLSFMHKNVSDRDFLSGVSKNNYLDTDVNYSLFSMGFYKKEGFWNIDLNLRANVNTNILYSAFELMKKGFAMNEASYYNVKDICATANSYLELGVGHSRPFLDNTLVVGAKAKVLIGLADFDLHIRDLKVDAGLDEWRIRSHASLQASAPRLTPEFDDEDKFDSFDWNDGFGIPGYGLGFYLGNTYSFKNVAESTSGALSTILSNLSLSVALTDIGFISWNKKNNNYLYSTLEDQVVTSNFVIDFDSENSSLQDDIDNIKDTFEEIIEFKEGDAKNRTTGLRTNLNIALEYEILKDLLSAGVISTTRFNAAQNITETTLAVTTALLSSLREHSVTPLFTANSIHSGWP
ncbi:MAG: DUF5723 family protein [Bacteroides sp.]|nr:DUF5723 family protein [Bacteroides sp.]